MPHSAPRPCRVPGCAGVVREGAHCAAHAGTLKNYDRRRPSASKRGYGRHWGRLRRWFLSNHPMCQWPGCREPASQVDHIVPLARGGGNDEANLQALCARHHSLKTAKEDGGFGHPRARQVSSAQYAECAELETATPAGVKGLPSPSRPQEPATPSKLQRPATPSRPPTPPSAPIPSIRTTPAGAPMPSTETDRVTPSSVHAARTMAEAGTGLTVSVPPPQPTVSGSPSRPSSLATTRTAIVRGERFERPASRGLQTSCGAVCRGAASPPGPEGGRGGLNLTNRTSGDRVAGARGLPQVSGGGVGRTESPLALAPGGIQGGTTNGQTAPKHAQGQTN